MYRDNLRLMIAREVTDLPQDPHLHHAGVRRRISGKEAASIRSIPNSLDFAPGSDAR